MCPLIWKQLNFWHFGGNMTCSTFYLFLSLGYYKRLSRAVNKYLHHHFPWLCRKVHMESSVILLFWSSAVGSTMQASQEFPIPSVSWPLPPNPGHAEMLPPAEMLLPSREGQGMRGQWGPSDEYSGQFPLGLTGLISLQSKGLSRVLSSKWLKC